jgi:hypothetical protein
MDAVLQWSDIARNPRAVAATVEREGEARLERRGEGQPFILIAAWRRDADRAGVRTAERLVRNAIAHATKIGDLDDLLTETFPWVRFLPADERKEFAEAFAATYSACVDLGTWAPLEQLMTEWRATAAIHADPVLAAKLRGPFDVDLGPAPEPEVVSDAEAG